MPRRRSPIHAHRRALLADFALFSVAVVWGANFVAVKAVVGRLTEVEGSVVAATLLYLFSRYVLATLVLGSTRPRALYGATRRQWAMGGLLGVCYLAAMVVQTIGLQDTTPGEAGFITGLSVAMVPFLYWAVAKRSPGWFQVLGALVATAGLGVLSLRGDLAVSRGDALVLVGAFLYALHITATGFFAPKVPPATLAVTPMAVSTLLFLIVVPFIAPIPLALPSWAWAAIAWTALSGTVYAFFVQAWAQRHTSAAHAAVVLCFESVFEAVAGVMVGMDTVTWRLLTGASLTFGGTLITDFVPGGGGRRNEAPAAALLPVERVEK
ncbi:MAG: DMT family transporter [Candidatus Limnocylindrales bacterium]